MSIPPNQQNPFFFPYRNLLTSGNMETENVENIDISEILQRQGMNDTQQGFYPPMTGLYMQNRIPMNITIPYNHMQGFLQVQGNPNAFNQQQVISNDDMQKSTEYLNKLKENTKKKTEEQLIQLEKDKNVKIDKIDNREKEEITETNKIHEHDVELFTKANIENLKLLLNYLDKQSKEENSEEKLKDTDSEKKENNTETKKPKKKDDSKKKVLLKAFEISQNSLKEGMKNLSESRIKDIKGIRKRNDENKKEINISYMGKENSIRLCGSNDYSTAIAEATIMGVAETNRNVKKLGMVTLEQNIKLNNITQGIQEVNSNAKGLESFINSEYTNTRIENQQLHNMNQELTNRNVQIETTNQMLNLTVNQKEEQITSLQMQNNSLQSGNTILQNNVNTLQQQNSEQQQRINELEEKNNLLKKTIDNNRAEIEKIMEGNNNTNDMRAIYLTALTSITQEIGKEFINYLSQKFSNVDKVNGLNEYELVNSFYTQNIEKHLNIIVNGTKISIIEIGKKLGFDEENFKIFIIEHLKNAFYSYMSALSQTTLNTNSDNKKAINIKEQSDSSLKINNNNTSESIVKEIRMIIEGLFSKMSPQQGYPQQQISNNPFGGFSNYIPFMVQPQYQGYPQQQYVPQQNTTQFTSQTQYQQQNNGIQNQQPDIKMQKITMPTGSTPNMTNNPQEEFKQEYSDKQQEVPQNTSTNNTYQIPEETNSNDIYIFKSDINKSDLQGNNRIATLITLYTEFMRDLRSKRSSINIKDVGIMFLNSLNKQGYGSFNTEEFNAIHKSYMINNKKK